MCEEWESEADEARALGMRVVRVRTGVVLARGGGALAKMLPPFKAGVGGPVAGGRQYVPWIHRDDVVGMFLAALDDDGGRARSTRARRSRSPTPSSPRRWAARCTARRSSRCRRFAIGILFGEMGQVVTTGQRAVPARPLELGYAHRHTDLDEALRDALR